MTSSDASPPGTPGTQSDTSTTGTPATLPTPPAPRLGGLIKRGGSSIAWTGGRPNITYYSLASKLTKPRTFKCYRMDDPSTMLKAYVARSTVPENFTKIEKHATADQFSLYVAALEQRFIENGTDSTLYVVDPSDTTTTTSVLKTYPRLTQDYVDTQMTTFKKTWDDYAIDNDQCNREFIYGTVGNKLRKELLLRDRNHDLPSASLFMMIASSAASITTSEINALREDLHNLKLDSFAGQDVSAFALKALPIHTKLLAVESFEQRSQQLVLQNLSLCSVERFRKHVYDTEAAIRDEIDSTRQMSCIKQQEHFVNKGIDFEKNLRKLETEYKKLHSSNLWPPKGNKVDTKGAPDINFATCTQAEANAAIQKMVNDGVKAKMAEINKDTKTHDDTKKDLVKCKNCGRQHPRNQKCPFKDAKKVDKLEKPGDGDPKLVICKGQVKFWCDKCTYKGEPGRWTATHSTKKHDPNKFKKPPPTTDGTEGNFCAAVGGDDPQWIVAQF